MEIEYSGDPCANQLPRASVERFEELRPTPHERSELGDNTDYLSWEYGYESSRWYDSGELVKLDPGEFTHFQSHRDAVEGPYEKCLCIFSGRGVLRTEDSDVRLEQFDAVLVPPNAAYQIGNTSTETLWFGWWASVGDDDLSDASRTDPPDRPGFRREYDRILATRAEQGLPTPPDFDGDFDGDTDESRPTPSVVRFSETRPKTFGAAPEIGATEDRPDWIYSFPDSQWFSQCTLIRLDPGAFVGFHAHFENEGPAEEIYWVLNGKARLQTEYRDTTLHQFDCAFFPTGCMHTMGNVGTERVWVAAWLSKGGRAGEFDIEELETSERPQIREQFERVMAARKKRGLSLPPNVDVTLR
ncbi:MAG: cupin domain-containing protein [Haloplanus sp.]